MDIFLSITYFFGINPEMFIHLLSPGKQMCWVYGGKKLKNNASPPDVGENILALIRIIKNYELKNVDVSYLN